MSNGGSNNSSNGNDETKAWFVLLKKYGIPAVVGVILGSGVFGMGASLQSKQTTASEASRPDSLTMKQAAEKFATRDDLNAVRRECDLAVQQVREAVIRIEGSVSTQAEIAIRLEQSVNHLIQMRDRQCTR